MSYLAPCEGKVSVMRSVLFVGLLCLFGAMASLNQGCAATTHGSTVPSHDVALQTAPLTYTKADPMMGLEEIAVACNHSLRSRVSESGFSVRCY